MANFINKYANLSAYEADSTKQYPNVSLLEDTHEIVYERNGEIDYSTQYFTTVALSDGNVTMSGSSTANTFSYSTDNGSTWSTPAQVSTVAVSNGDKVLWKGETTPTGNGIGHFTTETFNVEGNVMSLLFGDNFQGQTDLTGKNYAFYGLFNFNTKVESAENLVLPATTLVQYCYKYMFQGCRSLTEAPQLPATTLANNCYDSMFSGCTSLTTAPQLPATTLANDCYADMFANCTNLTEAPELPATTLALYCYYNMFANCTNLTEAPELPATTLDSQCYQKMFRGCRSLTEVTCLATNISASNCTSSWLNGVAASGTFTKAASMNDWTTGNNGIPNGWTVQDYQG